MAISVDIANLGSFSTFSTATTSVAFTTTSTVVSNSFIVVGVCWTGTIANITLAGVSGGGLSWTIDKQGLDNAGGFNGAALVSAQAPAGLASGTVITGTYSDTCDKRLISGSSLRGVKTSSPVDGTPIGPVYTAVGQAWSSGNYTTTAAGSAVTAIAWNPFNESTDTPTAPSLHLWQVYDTPHTLGSVGEYQIGATPGSYALAGSWGSNTQTLVVAVAYLATPQLFAHLVGMGRW